MLADCAYTYRKFGETRRADIRICGLLRSLAETKSLRKGLSTLANFEKSAPRQAEIRVSAYSKESQREKKSLLVLLGRNAQFKLQKT